MIVEHLFLILLFVGWGYEWLNEARRGDERGQLEFVMGKIVGIKNQRKYSIGITHLRRRWHVDLNRIGALLRGGIGLEVDEYN